MTSLLSSETVLGLTPLLGSIARLVCRGGHVSVDQVSILLESTEVEPTQEILAELERWSRLLEKARGSTDEGIRQAVEEALTQRGLPEATALLAVATVSTGQIEATAPPETQVSVSGLVVSAKRLDFGMVEEGQNATLSFTIQGESGEIVADSEQVTVVPQQFDSEMTVATVTVRPVHEQGTLWSTIRLISASGAVEIPIVAQWHKSHDKPDDSAAYSTPVSKLSANSGAAARKPQGTRPASPDTRRSAARQTQSPASVTKAKGAVPPGNKSNSSRMLRLVVVGVLALAIGGFAIRRYGAQQAPPQQTRVAALVPTNPTPTSQGGAVAEITPSPSQTPTATQTKTPRPTVSPTAKPTQTPTPDLSRFVVSGPPGQWMPTEVPWLSDFRREVDQEATNEEVAQNYADPDGALARFEEMRRVGSHWRVYSASDYCNLNSGIADVWLQITVFRQSEGVTSFIDFLDETDDFSVGEAVEGVGEQAWIVWADYESGCSPPQDQRSVEIRFRRFNVYVRVGVASILGSVADQDLVSRAEELAKAIDIQLLEEAP